MARRPRRCGLAPYRHASESAGNAGDRPAPARAPVHTSSLEPELLELVKMRASQLNGCAYCLDMHSKDARARGESEQRLYLLDAWREAPFFSERERAALAWCEALTLLPQGGAPDEVYAAVAGQFEQPEIVALTLAIVAINGWNRFAVGLRSPVSPPPTSNSTATSSPGQTSRPSTTTTNSTTPHPTPNAAADSPAADAAPRG